VADVTIDDVAAWMCKQVMVRPLYQDDAAWKIRRRFGKKFVYDNDYGNPAIDKALLEKFRELTGDDVVWSRSEKLWRKRTKSDAPGRMQE